MRRATLERPRNWWAPAPLRTVHKRFGLHEAPSTTRTQPTPTSTSPTEVTEPAIEAEPAGAGSGTMTR
jgi:hypothetical protein